MALELRKDSKWWYGRFEVSGRKFAKNLGIQIRGAVPPSLKLTSDKAFERSREMAQAKFDQLQEDMKRRKSTEEIVREVHRIRTGGTFEALPIADLFERWKAIPRRKKPSEGYVKNAKGVFERFVSYLADNYKNTKELADVRASMVEAFMDAEDRRGVSEKTYNNTLILLRSCCESLGKAAGSPENPFAGLPTKEEHTVHRKPFTAEELATIAKLAKQEEFIGPIILTGVCTAMRKGDCCLLKWESVDLKERFIAVKTSKTGETVRIPILPLFAECLEKAAEKREPGQKYVFPEQAMMYQTNPDGITWRAKQLYIQAGFDVEEPPVGEVGPKRLKKASLRDFHSLRVTWVTLALASGVPIEIVQKVTGHQTTQVVLKHYFQPGKDDYRRTLEGKLPSFMGGTTAKELPNREKLTERLKAMNGKNWKVIRDELLAGL